MSESEDGLPDCETCKGLRFVRLDVSVGHADFGQLTLCSACGPATVHARKAAIYHRHQERIRRYTVTRSHQTFADFDPRDGEQDTASVRAALQAAREFAARPTGWLTLSGTNGTGKSHLAAAIAHTLEAAPIERRPLILYITTPDLLDLLRSGYSQGDYHDLLDLCRQVDVLILDDLGAEKSSDWALEKLYQVLGHRYQSEQPTVIVTNCRLDELEPRLYDRLACELVSQVVLILAPSYRQRRKAPGRVVQ